MIEGRELAAYVLEVIETMPRAKELPLDYRICALRAAADVLNQELTRQMMLAAAHNMLTKK